MYLKSKLIEMNVGNWILNIGNIQDNEHAKIYPTGNASLSSGRFYVALPATTILTPAIIKQYNIWL